MSTPVGIYPTIYKPRRGDTANLSPRWGCTILPNITGAHAPAYILTPLQGSVQRTEPFAIATLRAPSNSPWKTPPPTPPKGERKDTHCGLDPQSHAAIVFLCSSLCFGREKKPRETMLHAPVRTNPTLQNCAAELASLKQSSHCLKAPFFNRRICCLPSRYRNNIRSKAPSLLGKATGRRM